MALANNQHTFPAAFVFEWGLGHRRRETILTVAKLRQQLSAYTQSNRLIVFSGQLDEATTADLRSCGVEGRFLDAHQQGKVYRHRTRQAPVVKTFCWKFPQLLPSGFSKNPIYSDGREEVVLLSASLWLGTKVPFLFIELPAEKEPLADWEGPARSQQTNLEDQLLQSVDAERQPVDVQLSQVVYERWRGLLESDGMKWAANMAYWDMTVAVERNREQARRIKAKVIVRAFKDEEPWTYADEEDWKDVLLGLERRVGIASLRLLGEQLPSY
ncbi:hypothetical protein ACHAQJ_005384 [Trichoderma viride]